MAILDVSPVRTSTNITIGKHRQSVSGKAHCVAMSPSGRRLYLGGQSGVWRSDDGGQRWSHLERPQPPDGMFDVPGALYPPIVLDLLISPRSSDVVLAAAGRDARRPAMNGVYRSTNGGNSWTRVHTFINASGAVATASCLAVAPDDPDLMLAAGQYSLARSDDGGASWVDVVAQSRPGQQVWYVVCGPDDGSGRRVYAVGSAVWYSRDGGVTWVEDPVRLSLSSPADAFPGQSSGSLAIDPADPTTIYIARDAGELWRGTYPVGGEGAGTWERLPAPPVGAAGTTASGTDYVLVHSAPNGDRYIICSDRRTVHLSVGDPAKPADWTRIDTPGVHVDPHGIALTPSFQWRGTGAGAARIAMVNDGGAVVSNDGTTSWEYGAGLSTLGLVNCAVLPRPRKKPGLVIQMGDNSGFSSTDGGETWKTQDYDGGDNDCSFADPLQPGRLIVFTPRDAAFKKIYLYSARFPAQIPDTAKGTSNRQRIPGPPRADDPTDDSSKLKTLWNAGSYAFNLGNRPMVLTLHGEEPRPDGDFVAIWLADTGANGGARTAKLLRTTSMSQIVDETDWVTDARDEDDGAKVFQQGPDLPDPEINVVQASGGHTSPTFYIGDPDEGRGKRVWKWRKGMDDWQPIVPGTGAEAPQRARRFFVDPYRPDIIYVLGDTHPHLSINGGRTWRTDLALESVLTQDGAYPVAMTVEAGAARALLGDMQFHPDNSVWRVAIGPSGLFQTRNGRTWHLLLHSTAAAMRPNNAVLDLISRSSHDLYVATSNRGVLRVEALPPRKTFSVRALAHNCLNLDPPISIRDDILSDEAQVSLLVRLQEIDSECT